MGGPAGAGLHEDLQALTLQPELAAPDEEEDDSLLDELLDEIYEMERGGEGLAYHYPEPVRIGTHERPATAWAETIFAYAPSASGARAAGDTRWARREHLACRLDRHATALFYRGPQRFDGELRLDFCVFDVPVSQLAGLFPSPARATLGATHDTTVMHT